MLLKTAKYLNIILVILMAMDFVGAAFTAIPACSGAKLNYHTKHTSSSGIAFILFEKEAEEETEKNEEREKFIGPELVDFSRVAVLLSNIHTRGDHFTSNKHRFSVRPLLFTLHCVFII